MSHDSTSHEASTRAEQQLPLEELSKLDRATDNSPVSDGAKKAPDSSAPEPAVLPGDAPSAPPLDKATEPVTPGSSGEIDRTKGSDAGSEPASPAASATPDPNRSSKRRTTRGSTGASQRQHAAKRAIRQLDPGDELECRLARMYFWQGSYARRGINMERHFYPEPLLVTDLDLLAYDISPQLELIKTIGEAKSGTSKTTPKPLDRAVWLAGLMKLVHADRASLVTALVPSTRIRDIVRALGVRAISTDDLNRWEDAWLPASLADCGSHGPTAFIEVELTRERCKVEPDLERVYWFLRSEVWFLDEWQATKRLIGAIDRLSQWWTPDIDDEAAAALRWLYAEALSVLTLNIVAMTGRSWSTADQEWPAMVRDRLSEGVVPAHHMHMLADSFDRYLARVLRTARANNTILVESMGAFHPSPPDWSEPFIELIGRLATSSSLVDLPRHTDLIMHERLVKRRHVSSEALERVSRAEQESLARDRRTIGAFLRACVRLPEVVSRALIA